ncbi:MAG: ABC transporter permease, partial [Rhodopirellula sp.]|nr:ABC transporter permease [Rhodopirellula sp.]
GKLYSSLRVSTVLTSFLIWPILLAWLLPPWTFWSDTLTILGYLAIILVTSLTTTILAMVSSILFRRTSVSMMTSYLVVMILFALPVAVKLFADLFYPASAGTVELRKYLFVSPFAAVFSLPLTLNGDTVLHAGDWWRWTAPAFLIFYTVLDLLLVAVMLRLFNVRWRVAR